MGKKVWQFRYYGDNDPRNQGIATTADLTNGELFKNYSPITQLGIQGNPGIKFCLNKTLDYPIVIGHTGIYELDLSGDGRIYAIAFDKTGLPGQKDNVVKQNSRLLIDIVYEGAGI